MSAHQLRHFQLNVFHFLTGFVFANGDFEEMNFRESPKYAGNYLFYYASQFFGQTKRFWMDLNIVHGSRVTLFSTRWRVMRRSILVPAYPLGLFLKIIPGAGTFSVENPWVWGQN